MNSLMSDTLSHARYNASHPLIRKFLDEGIKHIDFKINESYRGKAAQEAAYRGGHSKARWLESAHNYLPSVAVDIVPVPLDWNNTKSFLDVQAVLGWYNPKTGKGHGVAKQLLLPIRWGGDWNMNGITSDETLVDLPHYELNPWRDYVK